MTKDSVQEKRKKSNRIIISMILGVVAIIYVLAMIKMQVWA